MIKKYSYENNSWKYLQKSKKSLSLQKKTNCNNSNSEREV